MSIDDSLVDPASGTVHVSALGERAVADDPMFEQGVVDSWLSAPPSLDDGEANTGAGTNATPPTGADQRWWQRVGARWLFAIASAVSIFVTLWRLPKLDPWLDDFDLPIFLWVAAFVLFLAAVWSPVQPKTGPTWRPLVAIALGGIVLVAMLFRLIDLDGIPYVLFGDEGEQGLEARRVISGEIRSPFWTGWLGVPTMSFFYNSFSLRIFGDSMFGLRMAWAIVGIVTVPFTYLLARRLSGSTKFGLLAAALLATYHFHVHYSRLGSVQISDGLFLVVALWLYHLATDRNMAQHWVALGGVSGLSMYFYAGARLTLLVVIALFVYQLICRRGQFWRDNRRGFAIMLVAFAIVAAPMLQFAVNHWSEFNARISEVAVSGSDWFEGQIAAGRSSTSIWWDQFTHSLFAFNRYGDTTVWYGLDGPLLDLVFGAIFLLGLAVATIRVFRFRDERFAPVVAWWWAGMLSGGFLTLHPPSSQRLVTLTVPTVILIAVGLYTIAKLLRRVHRGFSLDLVFVVGAIAFALISFKTYFIDHPRDRFGAGHSALTTALAESINETGDDTYVYFAGEPAVYWGYGTMQFLVGLDRGEDLMQTQMTPSYLASLGQGQRELAFAVDISRGPDLDTIRSVWPDGVVESIEASDGRLMGYYYVAQTGSGPGERQSSEIVVAEGATPAAAQVSERQLWRWLGVGQLGEVRGIDVLPDATGAIIVDTAGLLVQVDQGGSVTRAVDMRVGQAEYTDVHVDDDGDAWVVDAMNARLRRVTPDDGVEIIAVEGGALAWARGIGPGVGSTLWIASPVSSQLTQIAADGAVVSTVPLVGYQPVDVIQGDDSKIWFIDAQDIRLVRMSPTGEVELEVGLDGFTSLEAPHLDIHDGAVWLTNPEASQVQAYDLNTGEAIGEPVLLRSGSGQGLNKALGIAVDGDGNIWVPDAKNGAITITSPVTE